MEIFYYIIETETHKSLLYFVLGVLFALFSYHIFRYLGNKNSSYLFYSLYCLFSMLAYTTVLENGFIKHIISTLGLDKSLKDFLTTVYNCFYFFFFCSFLSLKKYNEKIYNFIIYPILLILLTSTALFILFKFLGKLDLYHTFIIFFTLYISIFTVISFILLIKVQNPLKWYIIIGGIILFFTSIIGERAIRELIHIDYKMGDFIFFIGLIVENILFSLALGQQQKIEYKERVSFQKNLIIELQNGEKLREEINRKNQEKLISENEKIKIKQENSELALAAFRSQFNPHFIFNTLLSIKLYIEENDKENAIEYLNKFSRLIRLILSSSFDKINSLETEIEIIKLYMSIENLRFNNEMIFTVNIDPKIEKEKIMLPALVFQPFLENAIWHGIADVPAKKIEINILEKNNNIEVEIRDFGVGLAKAEIQKLESNSKKESYGTKISKESLKNFFGEQYSFQHIDHTTKENPFSGTSVIVHFPKNHQS